MLEVPYRDQVCFIKADCHLSYSSASTDDYFDDTSVGFSNFAYCIDDPLYNYRSHILLYLEQLFSSSALLVLNIKQFVTNLRTSFIIL